MEEGFLLDHGHANTTHPAKWVAGPPERSWFWGTKVGDKRQCQVRTFRCTGCGYLESYAG